MSFAIETTRIAVLPGRRESSAFDLSGVKLPAASRLPIPPKEASR